jgi:hypothetical protein
MNPIIILIITEMIALINCIKVTDFCHKIKINGKELDCHGKYNLNCAINFCTTDKSSCRRLTMFSTMTIAKEGISKREFQSFKNQIKDCSKPTYKLNANDICLNNKECAKIERIFRIESNECKCSGKHSYKCNIDFCAVNKQACDVLKNSSKKSIKKCKF